MEEIDVERHEGAAACAREELDRACERVVACVGRHPGNRELLCQILQDCTDPVERGEEEAAVAASPNFVRTRQEPYMLVRMLVRAGGLEELSYDEEGALLDEARVAELKARGADDDDVADLVTRRELRTTDAGCAALEEVAPEARARRLLADDAPRAAVYRAIVARCAQGVGGATFGALKEVVDACGAETCSGAQTSFFVGKLEEAGCLVWDGAWRLTDAGCTLVA